MKIFNNKEDLKSEIVDDKSVSFIPTMGGLHKGHVSLIKKAKKFKNKTLVSIFVNPKQFDKKNDYNRYPRNLQNDIKILKKLKINYLYLPNNKGIFNFKPKNKIYLHSFSQQLCGKYRKGHFKGVLNIVNRFLEIIQPKYIFLGLKDFQQLVLIEKHIIKNKINTKVIGCKTIRENNGVACSTRNFNLSNREMQVAKKIYIYLRKIKKKVKKNIKFFNRSSFKKELIKLGASKIY
jgi:pantoate--beta-alanine ligase